MLQNGGDQQWSTSGPLGYITLAILGFQSRGEFFSFLS